jgi:hypothetical protein
LLEPLLHLHRAAFLTNGETFGNTVLPNRSRPRPTERVAGFAAKRLGSRAVKIEADATLSFPRALVFTTYRDKLPELVPHLPNVRSIEVLEREEAPGGAAGVIRLLNLWKAKADIPKVAQGVIKPEMLEWRDFARWDENAWTCEWRVETAMMTESVRCGGKNRFIDLGETTRLEIRGDLDVDLKTVPGVPKFLAGTIAPVVEKFIVALLTPNLVNVSKGVEAFLKAR